MLTLKDLSLLPTHIVGSHGVPSWMWVFRQVLANVEVSPADIRDTVTDAVRLAILRITGAGLNIISDVEFSRADFTWELPTGLWGRVTFGRNMTAIRSFALGLSA